MTREQFIANCRLEDDGTALRFIDEWFYPKDFICAHTSGSTGKPKKIYLGKQQMRLSAIATNEFFGVDSNSLLALPLSTNYIAGKMMIVRALEAKSKLIVELPSNNPLKENYGRIDLLPIVPSQIDSLLTRPAQLNNIRHLLIGGAAPSQTQEKLLAEAGVNAWVSYGMTETCSHVALRRVNEPRYSALPGVSLATDTRGCLVIQREGFPVRFTTNDIVELLSQTEFIWKGRYDNVINSGGIKVYPETIEAKLSKIFPVGITFYIGKKEDHRWGEVPQLVLEGITESAALELLAMARNKLSGAERPADVKVLEKFQRTPNGKLIRI